MSNEQTITPAVFTIPEAAAYLSLGRSTVYKLIRAGKLYHSRLGKSIRLRREDLDKYIAENTATEYRRVDKRGRPVAEYLKGLHRGAIAQKLLAYQAEEGGEDGQGPQR